MHRTIVTLTLLALLPAFSLAPSGAAETVDAVCSTVTVLSGNDLSASFTTTACGPFIDYNAVRNPTDQTVVWSLTSDEGTLACTWPPGAGANCAGDRPLPASIGSSVTVTVSATSGDVVFLTRPGAGV